MTNTQSPRVGEQDQELAEGRPDYRAGARGRRRAYAAWKGMLYRCSDPSAHSYPSHGARGISVCPRWNSFKNFFADMGEPPDGLSLDRVNNNGNYEPGNCRWATWFQQNHNRRDSKVTEVIFNEIKARFARGESLTAISRDLDLSKSSVGIVRDRDVWEPCAANARRAA